MELRISFKETVIELVQDSLCQLAIFSGGCHIILIAHLEYHFIKSLFLFSITNFFIVVFDATVFTFLLGVKLCQSYIEQLMVRILNRCVAVFYVQMSSCLVNIFCEVGTAVVSNHTLTGHSADCSFYRRRLQNCGSLSKLVFAARRRVLLLLSKVTQKHF